jgi:glycerophosphoryl diester phosphodiesterase
VIATTVQAAASIGADIISPVGTAYASAAGALDPEQQGWIGFANQTMVDAAHKVGMAVQPWTPNRLNLIEYLLDIGVDGIITDYPDSARRYLEQRGGYKLAPKGDMKRVQKCLQKHNQLAVTNATV